MSWRAADNPEAIDALSMRWDFALAYLFPPIPLLKRVVRKLELSMGVFPLVTPYWEAQTWFTSLQALKVWDVRRLAFHNDLVINLSTGEPPPSLERLFLVIWKICGGLGESTPFRTGPSGLSRQDGSNPQKIATKGHQYGYVMKGLGLGSKNMLFVFRFSSLITFRKHKQ
jgi:hypothetical protein